MLTVHPSIWTEPRAAYKLMASSKAVLSITAPIHSGLHVLARRKHDKSFLYGVTSRLRLVPPSCPSDPPFLALP
jgi:hypothetical protein